MGLHISSTIINQEITRYAAILSPTKERKKYGRPVKTHCSLCFAIYGQTNLLRIR